MLLDVVAVDTITKKQSCELEHQIYSISTFTCFAGSPWGKYKLYYKFINYSAKLNQSQIEDAIARAFNVSTGTNNRQMLGQCKLV